MGLSSAAEQFATAVDLGQLELPSPGYGRTQERFGGLAALAARDLSFARLSEGHIDAVSILAEIGHRRWPEDRYGVWAAVPRALRAEPDGAGWRLTGSKPFCSGARSVTRALVTATAPDGDRLFEVTTADPSIQAVADSWPAVGMAGSESLTVNFDGLQLAAEAAIGGPRAYLERAGFWWGAVGVAACWLGGASRLVADVAAALATGRPDSTELAALGAAVAVRQSMRNMLDWAAEQIDADPGDQAQAGRTLALIVRQAVHAGCLVILEQTAAAGGARPLCQDAGHSRAAADLPVYLSQHHGGRDAAELGRLSLGIPDSAPDSAVAGVPG